MGREDRRRGDESENSLKQHFKERAGSSFTMLSQWIVAPDVEEMSMRVIDTGRQYQAEQARIKLKLSNEEARGNVISFGRIFRRVWNFMFSANFPSENGVASYRLLAPPLAQTTTSCTP